MPNPRTPIPPQTMLSQREHPAITNISQSYSNGSMMLSRSLTAYSNSQSLFEILLLTIDSLNLRRSNSPTSNPSISGMRPRNFRMPMKNSLSGLLQQIQSVGNSSSTGKYIMRSSRASSLRRTRTRTATVSNPGRMIMGRRKIRKRRKTYRNR